MERPLLSLCMIVKNESDVIERCLKSAKGIVDEMIVVDTGSVDNTREIAEKEGALVFDYQWNNDFATARNYAKEKATGEWIIQLDADEFLTETSREDILKEIDNAIEYALNVRIMNYDDATDSYVMHQYPRIYRNVPEIKYHYRIHEQLRYEGSPIDSQETNIKLIHTGYTKETIAKKNKTARNLRILQEELKENPNDPFMNFNIGNEMMKKKEYEKAIKYYQVAHKGSDQLIIKSSSILQMIKALNHQKRYDKALEIINDAKKVYSDYTDLIFMEAELYQKTGQDKEARNAYLQCLKIGEAPSKYLSTNGIGSMFPISKLADIALYNRDFNQALGYLTEVTDNHKYNFVHVKKIIGVLLTSFEEKKVIEFINESYSDENERDLIFKNRLAFEFGLYSYFSDSFKKTSQHFSETENRIIEFYLNISSKDAEKYAIDFMKKSELKHLAFVYYLFSKNKNVEEALYTDKTCRFMIDYLKNPIGEKRKVNYKKDLYMNIIQELMKIKAYEHVENLIPIAKFFDPRVYVEIGDLFFNYRQDDLAIEYYTKYLMKNKNDFDIYLKTANLLYTQGLYEEALLFSDQAHKINQNHFKPIEVMIESLKELKMEDETKKIAEQVLKSYPNSDYLKDVLYS